MNFLLFSIQFISYGIRSIKGISREELADAAELSVTYLYQVESGKKNIGLSALIKVAEALNVGFLSGVFAATALVFKIFSGPAIDSFSRKKLLMIAMGVMVFSYIGYGMSSSVTMLITFRLIEGAARAFTATCCLAIASDTLPASNWLRDRNFFTRTGGVSGYWANYWLDTLQIHRL